MLNAVDDRNRNALSWACHCRDEETIRFLLDRRCSIIRCQHFNSQTKSIEDNVNPLMLAVLHREIASDIIGLLVERLRDEKVSLTDETGYGRQAIHFAAQGGNCAAIKKLLQSDPALIHATSIILTSPD